MTLADYLAVYAIAAIWSLMFINVALTIGGAVFYHRAAKSDGHYPLESYPFVSILVPAHNEQAVIARTIQALLVFDYPTELYEIIVINDNSTDRAAEVLREIQLKHSNRRITIINTDSIIGGKGKSNALNIGLSCANGSVIAVYDADNTPEKQALRILVENLMRDERLAAVIGKFRTRNRDASIFTRFVNLETLVYQLMSQGGRSFYFKLCTIPGTNFVIRRSVLEMMGGWDIHALAEDTEISFRIYRMGYRIAMAPQAVTWEQEPFALRIWIKQRTRWSVGNIYVMINNFKYVFDKSAGVMRLDVIYYVLVYVMMLSSLVISDVLFILGFFGYMHTNLGGFSILLWFMASILFILNTSIASAFEKNEFSASTVYLSALMLFTYSKLWIYVVNKGIYLSIKMAITKREVKWYKTERSSD
ncbi:MAG: glycosyltransferase family 2 protein [Christensenellales bacterium]